MINTVLIIDPRDLPKNFEDKNLDEVLINTRLWEDNLYRRTSLRRRGIKFGLRVTKIKEQINVGDKFNIKPYNFHRATKAHVMYVLDGVYQDERFVVYKFYRKWWRVQMCTVEDFRHIIKYRY